MHTPPPAKAPGVGGAPDRGGALHWGQPRKGETQMEGTGRRGSTGPLHGPAGTRPMRVRHGSAYTRMAREVVQANPVCARCGGGIDLDLTVRARARFLPDGSKNPEYMHPMAGTAGHIVSVQELRLIGQLHRANERSNLRPEHRRCNSSAGGREGAKLTNGRRAGRPDGTVRIPSQEW